MRIIIGVISKQRIADSTISNDVSGGFWKLFQQNISNANDYQIIFNDESSTTDYHHLAIDDFSITNGICRNVVSHPSERKRRQVGQSKEKRREEKEKN